MSASSHWPRVAARRAARSPWRGDGAPGRELRHFLEEVLTAERHAGACRRALRDARGLRLRLRDRHDARPIQELASLGFMLLLGPSGTGKTHLAIAIGPLATHRGCEERFTSAADPATSLNAAATEILSSCFDAAGGHALHVPLGPLIDSRAVSLQPNARGFRPAYPSGSDSRQILPLNTSSWFNLWLIKALGMGMVSPCG